MKKFRVAVIGATGRGDYGHGLDVAWLEIPNAELVAVADADAAGLAEAVKRLKLDEKRAYRDYRRMLDEAKPDVVCIGTRWLDQHHDMVVAAAQRGIHIYMEKPLCRTLEEADAMIDACERTHTKLALAHITRYCPRIAMAKQLVAEGRIGQVLEFRGRGKEDAMRGGGEDLWVLGSHIMDLIRLFGGDPKWCHAEVKHNGERVTKKDVREGNEGIGPLAGDAVTAMYGMQSGATAYFGSHRNAAGNPSRFGLAIYGSRGVIEFQTGYLPTVKLLPDSSWSPGRSNVAWQNVTSAGIEKPEPIKSGGNHEGNLAAIRDLLDAIENSRQPKSSIYDGRAAAEMIVAVFDSHRAGGPVALPLANRKNPLAMLPT